MGDKSTILDLSTASPQGKFLVRRLDGPNCVLDVMKNTNITIITIIIINISVIKLKRVAWGGQDREIAELCTIFYSKDLKRQNLF
jgi:hypothetical protein